MTRPNFRLAPADAFTAARDGYLYGAAPVSQVTATIESMEAFRRLLEPRA